MKCRTGLNPTPIPALGSDTTEFRNNGPRVGGSVTDSYGRASSFQAPFHRRGVYDDEMPVNDYGIVRLRGTAAEEKFDQLVYGSFEAGEEALVSKGLFPGGDRVVGGSFPSLLADRLPGLPVLSKQRR